MFTAHSLVGQPGPDPANGALSFWTAQVFAESFPCQCGLVGDETVNAEIEQALHIPRAVDDPGLHLLTAAVRVEQEGAVEAVLLDAEEIDVQPRGLAGIERKQVADGYLRGELAHFE